MTDQDAAAALREVLELLNQRIGHEFRIEVLNMTIPWQFKVYRHEPAVIEAVH